MKIALAIALIVTAVPAAAAADGSSENSAGERRVCTQISVRAGSRMSGRRVCRTAAEWRETLGPDWRQHLAGSTGTQDDYDAVQTRGGASYDGSGGVAPVSSRGGPSPR